jgi:hypothetical protein
MTLVIKTHIIALALLGGLAVSPVSANMVFTTVPGTADPWLAGMPAGSTASAGDVAPAQSPTQVFGLGFTPGMALNFSATGSVNFVPSPSGDGPDGSFTLFHGTGAENGISDIFVPVNSLLGVFLGPDQPSLTPAPDTLVFGTTASRDYLTLSPVLKQVFFIGDGLTGGGMTQQVIVPGGATRLFLGTMDGSGWYDNSGSFSVRVVIPFAARV